MAGNALEAEKYLLGSILLDNSVMSLVLEIVKPEDFYTPINAEIYKACIKLNSAGHPIDVATIMFAVKDTNWFRDNGVTYIMDLVGQTPSSCNCVYYAKIIRNDALRRKLNTFADQLLAKTSVPVVNSLELATNVVQELSEISESVSESNYCDLKEAMRKACAQIEETVQNNGKLPGVSTGFVDLDTFLGGLRNGSLTILAARPAMGKTAFVVNILQNLCIREKQPALMFSLEMTQAELAMRIISSESKISGSDIRIGNLKPNQWDDMLNTVESCSDVPLYIDESSGITIATLQERTKQIKKVKDLKLVVVDYLQLLSSSSSKASNREQEIADITRELKRLAKDISCPVIAISQLNRSVESRAEKRPMLSDLRESGSIEQDADNVLFIHRPGYYDKNEKQDVAEIIVAKQRNGPTGIVHLKWIGQLTQFTDEIKEKHTHETFDDVEDADW
jgi:replicative DNA helicase